MRAQCRTTKETTQHAQDTHKCAGYDRPMARDSKNNNKTKEYKMMLLLLVLTAVFVVLKLTYTIYWPWWLVVLPAIIWVVIKLLA